MSRPDSGPSRTAPVRDASLTTLQRLRERLLASAPDHLPARLKELEQFLALLDDDLLGAYERGKGSQVRGLVERQRWVFHALDALAQGQREKALKALERALRVGD